MEGKDTNQRAVVVLGAARSGTSVTSCVLAALDVDMGNVGYPSKSNPRGSYQDRDFVRLNREIHDFTGAGNNYWNPPSPEAILESKDHFKDKIQNLVLQKSQGKPVWGWKDPQAI